MAGIPPWKKEKIQTIKSLSGLDSEDEDFIDQLVESDMQNTTLSLSQNPPVTAEACQHPVTQASTTRESRDPRLRKRKVAPGKQSVEKLKPKRKPIEKTGRSRSDNKSSEIKPKEPADHYPLREQIEGAWYVIYNTPSAPPSTPPTN